MFWSFYSNGGINVYLTFFWKGVTIVSGKEYGYRNPIGTSLPILILSVPLALLYGKHIFLCIEFVDSK